jgi:hAT family C-terminal dimerisation region
MSKAYIKIDIAPDAETMLDVLRALKPLRAAFPRVIKLYQLASTLPVSTASCERSFSCIKRVKTYTRTTMTEGRLTGLALMSIVNELTKTDTFINEVSTMQKIRRKIHDRYHCSPIMKFIQYDMFYINRKIAQVIQKNSTYK